MLLLVCDFLCSTKYVFADDQPNRNEHGKPSAGLRSDSVASQSGFRYQCPDAPKTIVYGIIPSLAGGLAGVNKRIPEIAKLGVNAIWLSPITNSPGSDFGYAVTDHFSIRPSLGTPADLKQLVETAHKHKIRVLLDMAVNHLSDQHPFYKDAVEKGKASKYYKYFDRNAKGEVTNYFDWHNLKNLNFSNSKVRSYVTNSFAYWVREYNVDGFRVDASWGVKERAPDFWPKCIKQLRKIKPDLLMIAESSTCDPYYATAGFDAAYDWTKDLGKWAWEKAFDAPEPATALRKAISLSISEQLTFRFINNNDTGKRFISKHSIGLTRVAAAMLMTLPGIPCIYMGDENGSQFEPYGGQTPNTVLKFPEALTEYYRRLIQIRNTEPAITGSDFEFINGYSDNDRVLIYKRGSSDDSIFVFLNFSDSPFKISALTMDRQMRPHARPYTDLLDLHPNQKSLDDEERTVRHLLQEVPRKLSQRDVLDLFNHYWIVLEPYQAKILKRISPKPKDQE